MFKAILIITLLVCALIIMYNCLRKDCGLNAKLTSVSLMIFAVIAISLINVQCCFEILKSLNDTATVKAQVTATEPQTELPETVETQNTTTGPLSELPEITELGLGFSEDYILKVRDEIDNYISESENSESVTIQVAISTDVNIEDLLKLKKLLDALHHSETPIVVHDVNLILVKNPPAPTQIDESETQE